MVDLDEGGSLSGSDIQFENAVNGRVTADLFTFERESISSVSIVSNSKGRLKMDSIDSELDWKNSTTSLPPERRHASKFLNPSPTPRAYHRTVEAFSSPKSPDGVINISNFLLKDALSLERAQAPRIDIAIGSHHKRSQTSPTLILPPKEPEHVRSSSGTRIITGICSVLPDVIEPRPSPSPTPPNPGHYDMEIRQRPSTQIKKVEDDDLWSSDEDESDAEFVSSVDTSRPPKRPLPLQSRRGSELLPPKQIWVTGGPSPGLYCNKGKLNGRPKWLGAKAQICWNPEARAWLLISRNTSELDAALAMLCVESNHPCITTTKWRVGKGAKKGVSHSFYETYAFKIDNLMMCTKYLGSSNELPSLLVEESTLVKIRRGIGIVRFVGPLEDKNGMFAGVELFSPTGLNNGTRKGFFYFEAKPRHGIFVRLPKAVKQIFGPVSDQVATFMDDLIETAGRIKEVSESAIERLIKIMVVLGDGESVFCKRKINVLGIILFYDLIML